jgi:outer membrane receptor protein involved in Fe transport
VVVTASREGQARQDAPIAISKINSTQIKDTKATALYQLLNKVAGVYMVNLGNEQHTMAIRQPITYNALYLYMEDGLPIRPTGIFNHNSLYEINMSGVKDIEVIKGPASSLYGSNSIGGAVNFITQGPPQVMRAMFLFRAIITTTAGLMPTVVLPKANLACMWAATSPTKKIAGRITLTLISTRPILKPLMILMPGTRLTHLGSL